MKDVFDFYIDGVPVDDYILDRTMLRPRDAKSFVNYCLRECDGYIEIKEEKNVILTYILDRVLLDTEDELHSKIVMNFDELMKVWFIVGVIGIKRTETLVIYSSYDKPDLDITDINRNFIIHPLFNKR